MGMLKPLKRKFLALLLFVFPFSLLGSENAAISKFSLRNEIIELGAAAGVTVFTQFYLANTPVWTGHPLLKTNTQAEYKEETIKDYWFIPLGLTIGTGIGLLPNKSGRINIEAYQHVKGFLETAFVITPLIDEIVKHSVGKKRPNYDAGMALYKSGGNIDTSDLRESFYSGHAAISYGMATYAGLFLFRNVPGCDGGSLAWKISISACTYGLATYISCTRLTDNLHEPVDVIAGGLCGAAISAGMYFITEHRMKNSRLGISLSPNSLLLSINY